MFVVFIAVTSLVLGACKTNPPVPTARDMPAGKNFSGLWYSPHYEHMYVTQVGDTVRGVYAYNNGGEFQGTVNGNMLTFRWIDPGNRQNARRPIEGHGYLQLFVEGDRTLLKGAWGYDDAKTGGGPWEAEYVRPLESEDPQTIEQIKAVH
ncbi:MAG: hypothetical protein H0U74_08495 [Bradymonadaceae bacterium]|nr:hypothetical protein [Lujinxingiaceae bacterium]